MASKSWSIVLSFSFDSGMGSPSGIVFTDYCTPTLAFLQALQYSRFTEVNQPSNGLRSAPSLPPPAVQIPPHPTLSSEPAASRLQPNTPAPRGLRLFKRVGHPSMRGHT